jgi:hypothetical protein
MAFAISVFSRTKTENRLKLNFELENPVMQAMSGVFGSTKKRRCRSFRDGRMYVSLSEHGVFKGQFSKGYQKYT